MILGSSGLKSKLHSLLATNSREHCWGGVQILNRLRIVILSWEHCRKSVHFLWGFIWLPSRRLVPLHQEIWKDYSDNSGCGWLPLLSCFRSLFLEPRSIQEGGRQGVVALRPREGATVVRLRCRLHRNLLARVLEIEAVEHCSCKGGSWGNRLSRWYLTANDGCSRLANNVE